MGRRKSSGFAVVIAMAISCGGKLDGAEGGGKLGGAIDAANGHAEHQPSTTAKVTNDPAGAGGARSEPEAMLPAADGGEPQTTLPGAAGAAPASEAAGAAGASSETCFSLSTTPLVLTCDELGGYYDPDTHRIVIDKQPAIASAIGGGSLGIYLGDGECVEKETLVRDSTIELAFPESFQPPGDMLISALIFADACDGFKTVSITPHGAADSNHCTALRFTKPAFGGRWPVSCDQLASCCEF